MLYLYTEDFFWPARAKNTIKAILGRDFRGPQAVLRSLQSGLFELGIEFSINKSYSGITESAFVLSGPKVLAWAIRQKRLGNIKKLLAGPNVVVTPFDFNKLILAPEIDRYIVPAQWSVDWWIALCPELKGKMSLWPSGVTDCGMQKDRMGEVMLIQKNAEKSVLNTVQEELNKRNIVYTVLIYGKFSQEYYYEKISHAPYLINLSRNESQGLALHEAWMANVPTLVWNPGVLKYKDYTWNDPKLAAPYMENVCGIFFKDEIEFSSKLDLFLSKYNGFKPRDYSLLEFTNKVSSQNLINILNSL